MSANRYYGWDLRHQSGEGRIQGRAAGFNHLRAAGEFHSMNFVLPTEGTLLQQVFCEGTAAFFKKLCLKYPIRSDLCFPDKQVYSSGSDVWELNSLRLQVWASHLVHRHTFIIQLSDLLFLSRTREL